jgi:5-methylcytosine-specific restriction endonuclease McrA
MRRKPKTQRAVRTRNANTMTEAEYWGKVRSALRKAFAYWKPAQEAVKRAECGTRTNPKTGRQKKVYRCAVCGESGFREEMQIDHVEPCGSLRSADDVAVFLERLTCEDGMKFQLLHKTCHQEKTNEGRRKLTQS